MARGRRRGKGLETARREPPKEEKPSQDEGLPESTTDAVGQHRLSPGSGPASLILADMLQTLGITFDGEMGMLNGKNVRNVPEKKTLLALQTQIERLQQMLEHISAQDEDAIRQLRKIQEQSSLPVRDDNPAIATTQTASLPQSEKHQSVGEELASIPEKETQQEKDSLKRSHDEVDISQPHSTNDDLETRVPAANKDALKKAKLDIDRIENDPYVKNSKTEFVVSQTLPAAAAALGLFNEEGLECTGEDYLKKKFSVASYPTNDLKEYLPGELPDKDYSCPKPTNQIQFNTFLSYVENFFRDFTDDDVKFLQSKYIIPAKLALDKTYDPDIVPYTIPKLGPLYTEVWSREDRNNNSNNDENHNIDNFSAASSSRATPSLVTDPSSILPKGNSADINDTTIETEEVSCGPLVSRLLSAILKNDGNNNESASAANIKLEDDMNTSLNDNSEKPLEPSFREQSVPLKSAQTPVSEADNQTASTTNKILTRTVSNILSNDPGWKINSINLDYPTFEERLKRELRYVGIYMNLPKDQNRPNGDDPDWLTGREDDEISAELRELQSTLKEVTLRNQKRKEILLPHLERALAWQEYMSILDDLDKQTDQAYIKRIRVPKKKKKHHHASNASNTTSDTSAPINSGSLSQAAQQKAANSSLKALLDKRQRWINKIGPLFDKPEVMKRISKESIFHDMDQDDEDEEADVFGQNNTNKDDELAEA